MITYSWLNSCCANLHELELKLKRLLLFLTSSRPSLQLCEAIQNPLFHVVLAHDDASKHDVIGMASIFYQRNLFYVVAEVHDVVVDPAYRGQGIGKKLLELLIANAAQYARMVGREVTLSLTSKPKRIVANTLYAELGFVLVASATGCNGTNLYKMVIKPLNPI